MTIYRQSMKSNDVKSHADVYSLRERTENLSKKYQPSRITLKAVKIVLMCIRILLRLM